MEDQGIIRRPVFFEEEMPEGPAKGAVLNRDTYDRLLDDYYESRGWDRETGIPSTAKLNELGLEAE